MIDICHRHYKSTPHTMSFGHITKGSPIGSSSLRSRSDRFRSSSTKIRICQHIWLLVMCNIYHWTKVSYMVILIYLGFKWNFLLFLSTTTTQLLLIVNKCLFNNSSLTNLNKRLMANKMINPKWNTNNRIEATNIKDQHFNTNKQKQHNLYNGVPN